MENIILCEPGSMSYQLLVSNEMEEYTYVVADLLHGHRTCMQNVWIYSMTLAMHACNVLTTKVFVRYKTVDCNSTIYCVIYVKCATPLLTFEAVASITYAFSNFLRQTLHSY